MLQEDLSNPADRQFTTIRIIDAPLDKVYRAWTEPRHLAEWWGPNGFTNTFHTFDHQPGGRWIYTMHGPDFVGHFENEATFLEIIPNRKLMWDRQSRPHFITTVNFEALDDKTQIHWVMEMTTQSDYDKMKGFVPEKNEENLDRLVAYLQTMD